MYSTIVEPKYIPTTRYETIYKTKYETEIVPEYVPQYFTETKLVDKFLTVTNYLTSFQTKYKTRYVTETQFKPSYITTTAIATHIETRYQPQYITETEVTPVSKTKVLTKTEIIYQTKYVDKHFDHKIDYPLANNLYDDYEINGQFEGQQNSGDIDNLKINQAQLQEPHNSGGIDYNNYGDYYDDIQTGLGQTFEGQANVETGIRSQRESSLNSKNIGNLHEGIETHGVGSSGLRNGNLDKSRFQAEVDYSDLIGSQLENIFGFSGSGFRGKSNSAIDIKVKSDLAVRKPATDDAKTIHTAHTLASIGSRKRQAHYDNLRSGVRLG